MAYHIKFSIKNTNRSVERIIISNSTEVLRYIIYVVMYKYGMENLN